ncbi:DUF1439 domain-containing protein [Robbsia sp. Bb-Pol-6]|uniref:DUF1439 domain-containing protein n=1 Tax=Robbsia betulipollinis TaxID=2981849 RepID=A0ABT3ZM07_9BURK|nr:DUF1439 domain-containing protein [Robbsia betulipollinis]MCY0387584.1 DUF1439 domain-containing protein [Robbsia betulipollinis]
MSSELDRRTVSERRRLVLQLGVATALAGVLPLGACATFPFLPDHYTFSVAEMQRAVARKFPYHKRISQIVDLTLDDPVLGTRPDANRLSIGAHAHIESPFLQAPADGHFVLTSALAYDRERQAIVLRSPAIDSLDFPDLSGPYRGEIRGALELAVSQLLEGFPIYTFKPDQLSFAGVHYEPGEINVLPKGVRVQIVER